MSEHVDVLLLTTPRPPYLSPNAMQVSENSAPPLGLLCVAAALESAGFSVAVHDFYQRGGKPRDVEVLLTMWHPRIVGISTLTSSVHLAIGLCRHIKTISPKTWTVLGGPHATALPVQVVNHPSVDFAVRGEGEVTMVELAHALLRRQEASPRLESIAGFAFKRNGEVLLTDERTLMSMDEASWPARHLVPLNEYLQRGAIITSRGCSYHCWFCSSVTFRSHQYRYRQADSVLAEMIHLENKYGITSFEFIEDTFTCAPERVRALMKHLKGHAYQWSCQATIPDLYGNPDLTRAMVQAGCEGLFFGIESGNDKVLRTIKSMSRMKILDVVDRAIQSGVEHLVTSFIIGHPWDTPATIEDTVDLVLELRKRGAHTPISILVPFPGSPIGNWPERFGVTVHSHDYSEYYYNRALISTPHLKREDLERIYLNILEKVIGHDSQAD